MIDKNRMKALAEGIGVPLQDDALQKLDDFAALLLSWNERMNLTAITQQDEIETKHFLDCLQVAACPQLDGSVVDVGSGAGFPGVVLGIARPGLQLTLMEPTGKRVAFLQAVSDALGLAADIVKERAEEAARKAWRQQFDVATARAVAPLPQLCEYCMPLVKPGGWFIAMKGGGEEPRVAQKAIEALGGRLHGVQAYTLPNGDGRSLVLVQKVADTPAKYPRAGGVIKKRPLG